MTNDMLSELGGEWIVAATFEPSQAVTVVALATLAAAWPVLRRLRRQREGERTFAAYRDALAESAGVDRNVA